MAFRSALVTGATGFIGSALVRRLLAGGIPVTCIVRDKAKAQRLCGNPALLTAIAIDHWSEQNLRNALVGQSAEVVFHLASYGVHANHRDPQELADGNKKILIDLLGAVSGSAVRRFIFVGSCAEYGFPARDGSPIIETQPLSPTSPYGTAKAAAENAGVKLAPQLNVPFTTLRLFNVFGPGEAPQRLLPFIIDHLRRDEPAELTGGEQVRDFVYLDDAVDAMMTAASSDCLRPGEAYNVCSGRGTSVRQVGEIAADSMNKPRSLLLWGKRPYRRDEPMWLVGDTRRFTDAVSWQPKVGIAEGIARMIAVSGQFSQS